MTRAPADPNWDEAAERACLSAAMITEGAMMRLAAILQPEDFGSDGYATIFRACRDLHVSGHAVDSVTVGTQLRADGALDRVGGMSALIELLDAAPAVSLGAVNAYARSVRQKARVRALMGACRTTIATADADHGDDLQFLERSVRALTDAARGGEVAMLKDNRDALVEWIDELKQRAARGTCITGLPTGIDRYDRLTAGLHSGQLTIVGARPGQGKTSLGVNIATHVAQQDFGAIFISLEMSRAEILTRIVSSATRINSERFRTGQLSPSDWSTLMGACQSLTDLPLWIDDTPGMTVDAIRARVMTYIDQVVSRKRRVGVIVIDYLQKIATATPRGRQRYEMVGELAAGCKQLARDTALPVVALAQLRRLGKTDVAKRPSMDDLRESGNIEQEADVVTLIHRDPEMPNVAELVIDKARNGRTGVVKCRWVPELTRYENLSESEYDNG